MSAQTPRGPLDEDGHRVAGLQDPGSEVERAQLRRRLAAEINGTGPEHVASGSTMTPAVPTLTPAATKVVCLCDPGARRTISPVARLETNSAPFGAAVMLSGKNPFPASATSLGLAARAAAGTAAISIPAARITRPRIRPMSLPRLGCTERCEPTQRSAGTWQTWRDLAERLETHGGAGDAAELAELGCEPVVDEHPKRVTHARHLGQARPGRRCRACAAAPGTVPRGRPVGRRWDGSCRRLTRTRVRTRDTGTPLARLLLGEPVELLPRGCGTPSPTALGAAWTECSFRVIPSVLAKRPRMLAPDDREQPRVAPCHTPAFGSVSGSACSALPAKPADRSRGVSLGEHGGRQDRSAWVPVARPGRHEPRRPTRAIAADGDPVAGILRTTRGTGG